VCHVTRSPSRLQFSSIKFGEDVIDARRVYSVVIVVIGGVNVTLVNAGPELTQLDSLLALVTRASMHGPVIACFDIDANATDALNVTQGVRNAGLQFVTNTTDAHIMFTNEFELVDQLVNNDPAMPYLAATLQITHPAPIDATYTPIVVLTVGLDFMIAVGAGVVAPLLLAVLVIWYKNVHPRVYVAKLPLTMPEGTAMEDIIVVPPESAAAATTRSSTTTTTITTTAAAKKAPRNDDDDNDPDE